MSVGLDFGAHSALGPAGPQAARIETLWWVMFWVSAVVLITVILAFVVAVLRRRAGPGTEPGMVRPLVQPGPEHGPAAIVSGATLLTVIVLFGLLVASVATGRGIASLGATDPLTIEVTGHQWWWDVRYDAHVPAHRVRTANEIHIPVGQPILLKLRTSDVIHSFWVPSLHGKRDLIPGQTNTLWLQADRPGTYRGQCAEFCGHQHAHMGLLVVAEPPERFAGWQERQRQPAAEPADALARRGREVFVAGPCALCHAVRGTEAAAEVAPDLTHLGSRLTIAAATLANTPGHLAGWIVDPQRLKPGSHMPPMSLAADDLQALLAYLGSLR